MGEGEKGKEGKREEKNEPWSTSLSKGNVSGRSIENCGKGQMVSEREKYER